MQQEFSILQRDVREFIVRLQAVEQTLLANNEHFWREQIVSVKEAAQNSDPSSIKRFLRMFGGMGSLNDLILNGSATANKTLSAELNRAYSIAYHISKSLR
jgi:hypothetical protein